MIINHLWSGLLRLLLLLILCAACTQAAPETAAPTPALTTPEPTAADGPYAEELALLLDEIELMGVHDPAVLQAMATVPRHEFVPAEYLDQAYADHPLPIGYGQTISQPYIVAWMTELLELQPGERVLEIGTGSGYQAAVLAELGLCEVYSIEIVPELAESAAQRLARTGVYRCPRQAGGWLLRLARIMPPSMPSSSPPPRITCPPRWWSS